jgi:hypothetical protein
VGEGFHGGKSASFSPVGTSMEWTLRFFASLAAPDQGSISAVIDRRYSFRFASARPVLAELGGAWLRNNRTTQRSSLQDRCLWAVMEHCIMLTHCDYCFPRIWLVRDFEAPP